MNKSLSINIIRNISGFALPLFIGVACTPFIIHGLGTTRFGFLSVAWVIIGYFSVFDLGLGRALTQAVAGKLGAGREDEIFSLTRKTLKAMGVLSLAGALALFGLSEPLLRFVLHVPAEMMAEARITIYILSIGIPAVVMFSGLRGLLEALNRFDASAIARSSLGIWTFISPLLIFPFSHYLAWIVTALVIGRYAVLAYLALTAWGEYSRRGYLKHTAQASLKDVLRFGGWMTVSNLISPIMVYMDRFFVSAICGLSIVAFYTTPYDFVSRLSFIPEAIFGVVFPSMARHHTAGGDALLRLYNQSLRALCILMFAITGSLVAISPIFLRLWLGAEFEQKSSLIMSLLAIGLFINSMARPSYNLLQAKGLANRTAQLHMIELPIYIAMLIFFVKTFGILGAALAWVLRATLDFLMLSFVAHGNMERRGGSWSAIIMCLILTVLLIGLAFVGNWELRIGLWCIAFLAAAAGMFFYVLDEGDKRLLGGLVSKLRGITS